MPTIEPIDRDPVEHGFEDRELDLVVRGQRDEYELPAAAQRPIRLLERAGRDGERDPLVDAAEPLDRLDRVFLLGVDGELGAELAREFELVVDHVDRDDSTAGDRRVLDREVSEAADAEHGHEIGGAGARDFDRFVGGHTGAGERRGVERVDAFGDLDDVVGVGGRVLAQAPSIV